MVRITGRIEAGKTVTISPPLRFSHAAGRRIRKATVATAGTLVSDAAAGATTIRLSQAAVSLLAHHDSISIQGNAEKEVPETEVVRIAGPVEAGEELVINPALRFAHAAGRKIRRATNPATAQDFSTSSIF